MKEMIGSSGRNNFLAAFVGLALLNGCAVDAETSGESESEVASAISRQDNAVVVDWGQIAYDSANAAGYFGPLLFHHDRAFAMMHIAQHDALNAIQHKYEQYAYKGRAHGANPIAAAAQAAHDVLVNVYPDQAASLDAKLAAWLAKVPNSASKTKGITLGAAAAAAIIAQRATDGIDIWGEYTPSTGPGAYQYTPGFPFLFQPAFKNVPPFTMTSPSQFRSVPPPALTSDTYTADYNEVKANGAINSTTRTQDQTEYAAFWYEMADAQWSRMARITAEQEGLDLWRTARMFALNNMVIFDSYVAGWDSKIFYDRWRPITAIHDGDNDTNPATVGDPTWDSFQVAPPIQDYPSTHSVIGQASAVALQVGFGTDAVTFDFNSFSALPGKEIRTYNSFQYAAIENADSRVQAGIHFRSACDAGLEMGEKIGLNAAAHYLRPE